MTTPDELLHISASEMARRIRAGTLTSVEAVSTHIDEIKRKNPSLNAVVVERFDDALREARQKDAERRDRHPDDLPAFHGVPCTIKECFSFTGMPNTSGLVSRKGTLAESDATAVRRLREAGFVPMGVTNVSELCMWMESDNKVYGRTNNPYDPRRIVGGSSGGEGAIVGSGASPVGLGSDIGGSIRMPAFFNGVFGHKPTGGAVPNSGQHPEAHGAAARYCTTGPLTRRAEDLHPVLSILAGPDGLCEGATKTIPLGDPSTVSLRGLSVFDIPDDGRTPVSRDLRRAQARARDALRERGAEVRTFRPKALRHGLEIWSSALSQNGQPYAELLGAGQPVHGGRALLDFVRGRSPYTLPSIALVLLEGLVGSNEAETKRFVELGAELYDEFERTVGPEGVFLYPSHAWVAPKHGVPLAIPILFVYTALLNILEVPATQVPLGLDRNGVPLGVQVGALRGQDHRTIAVAQALERAFGGWVRPG